MNKTNLSFLLSLLCALDLFLGAVAALVIAAFVAGVLFEQHRRGGAHKDPKPPDLGDTRDHSEASNPFFHSGEDDS
jgi:hypothetical protein